jgi:hypothetical protein
MKTKRKIWTAALCLGLLSLLGGGRLSAADKTLSPEALELKAKMKAEGWKEISTGVYERQRGPNKVEHLGYGREGFAWTVRDLSRQRDELLKEYQAYPSEDLHKTLDELSVKIADTERELRNTKSLSSYSANATGCSICYGATADAYPLSGSSGQGVGAMADANFSSSCGNSGDTYAYAYARATLSGTTNTITVSDPHTGSAVTSHAAATVNGTSNCLSTANSYAQSTALGISYSTSSSNSTCPAPPPTVTVSSTTPVSISGTSCQTITWTSSVSGGTSPFSYAWAIDGVATGTSSSTSVSKTYCGNGTAHSQTVNAALTVTDAASQTGSNTFATTINYTSAAPTATIGGPTYVYGTSCKTVTWTSTVTGGTPAYHYAWTVNGTAIGTSTSTSVSKTFCAISDSIVNVALTVTDALSQTSSATYSTEVDIEQACGGSTGIICP